LIAINRGHPGRAAALAFVSRSALSLPARIPMIPLGEPARTVPTPPGFALFALGFRPFYLLAAVFAALSIGLWVVDYAGIAPVGYGRDPVWHAHEMLYGYTIAVVAGFLLTAVRVWTGQPTPSGVPLAAIVGLWIAGRVVVLTGPALVAAIVNAAFPLVVAIAISVPLIASRNRRNYFFVPLLAGVGVATLGVHLAHANLIEWPARAGLQAGLDIVLFIMAVVGGRVIPMFTNNGVPGVAASRRAWLEKLALGSLLALLAADVLQLPSAAIALLCTLAALAHAGRLFLWQPWRTLRVPLVWVLHVAYGWIVVHLLLRALAHAGLVIEPLATHALTLGAIGGLTLGMMTRTARGHTARPLKADAFETTAYLIVNLAAVVRVFGGLLVPSQYVATVVLSGVLWALAFALYAIRYWPVLSRPRLDGKPG
jgi:uncharacterized protein involved in response to NO